MLKSSTIFCWIILTTIFLAGRVDGLLCHRCSFVEPYNLFTQPIIDTIIGTINDKTGRNYKYNKNCESLPSSDDLVEAAPFTISNLVRTQLYLVFKFIQIQSDTLNHTRSFKYVSLAETWKPNLDEPQPTFISSDIPPMCLSAKMKVDTGNIMLPYLTVAMRDGLILANLPPFLETMVKDLGIGDCLGLEQVIGILMALETDQMIIDEFMRLVKEIELCACFITDGCNSDDQGVGVGSTESTVFTSTSPKESSSTLDPSLSGGTGNGPISRAFDCITILFLLLFSWVS